MHEMEAALRWEFYIDEAGEWRWRCIHRNGNILFVSGESYKKRIDAEQCAVHAGWLNGISKTSIVSG